MNKLKSVLAIAAIVISAMPLMAQQKRVSPHEVISEVFDGKRDNRVMIRPQRGGLFTAVNVSLNMLINSAYDLKSHQSVGGPSWADSEHFDIEAKAESSVPFDQMKPQLNNALLKKKIVGGLPLGRFYPELKNTMLLCATEMSRRENMDTIAEAFHQ